mmetsp:Transcript_46637/g.148833  ORF Transcript_46637/g.148833 Transcript_46637/m.148833 type:complete len:81 (-) Transcript_46637:393-635(-)
MSSVMRTTVLLRCPMRLGQDMMRLCNFCRSGSLWCNSRPLIASKIVFDIQLNLCIVGTTGWTSSNSRPVVLLFSEIGPCE